MDDGGRIVATPAHKLSDRHGQRAIRGNGRDGGTNLPPDADAHAHAHIDGDHLVPHGRLAGRGAQFEETVVLDRDPHDPEVWWFGHLIDGDLGKRGRLRHDRSTHETTLVTGHDGGVYATAALLVHQACDPMSVHPTYFVYDVGTQRLDMRDCDCPDA
jgi:hypothetical protein